MPGCHPRLIVTCLCAATVTLLSIVESSSGQGGSGPSDRFGTNAPLAKQAALKGEQPPFTSLFRLEDAGAREVRIKPVNAEALLAEDDREAAFGTGRLRVSVGRPAGMSPIDGPWHTVPGGKLWLGEVHAEGALALRVHFAETDLPIGAEAVVYAPDLGDSEPWRFAGHGPESGVQGAFWSPCVPGDRVRVELFIPAPDDAADPEFDGFLIDEIQYGYRDVFDLGRGAPARADDGGLAGGAGACHNIPACYTPTYDNLRKAVGRINFVDGGFGFECSGTLIATTTNDQTPYFLTAAHCIDTPEAAQSAQVFWRYEAATCAGAPTFGPTSNGCSLASTFCLGDASLLMVEGALPTGAYWAGWATAAPPGGQATTCLHHPAGSWMRISFGTKGNTPQVCSGLPCGSNSTNFALVTWNDGVTEPGSSGSGMFRTDTQQLFGTLSCGGSSCATPGTPDTFARFDRAWIASGGNFAAHLTAGTDDALEPNDSCATAASLPIGTTSNLIIKSTDEDWYRVSLLAGATVTVQLAFTNSNGDVDMQLYNACGGAVVASSLGNLNAETITYSNSGAAADFFLRVFLDADTRNSYTMTAGFASPLNNTCINATLIQPGLTGFSTLGATTDGPNEPAACTFNGYAHIQNDVWFKFLASCSGNATISLCDSTFDTKVAAYLACPNGVSGQTLACNDNACGSASVITFPVTQGTMYRIRIGGFNGAMGTGLIQVSCIETQPPACPADIAPQPNGNGAVDIDDLFSIIAHWGETSGFADIDASGSVDIDDLFIVISAWGACQQ